MIHSVDIGCRVCDRCHKVTEHLVVPTGWSLWNGGECQARRLIWVIVNGQCQVLQMVGSDRLREVCDSAWLNSDIKREALTWKLWVIVNTAHRKIGVVVDVLVGTTPVCMV